MARFELNSDSEAEEAEICESKINNCFLGFREESDIDSYELVLILDNREIRNQKDRNYIYDKLGINHVSTEKRNLPIGDFAWILKIKRVDDEEFIEYVLDFIVERKTVDDLAASIRDGRYDEQKYRLANSPFKNIVYLIEGQPSRNINMNPSTIQSAILHTQVYNSFFVIRQDSIQVFFSNYSFNFEGNCEMAHLAHSAIRKANKYLYNAIHRKRVNGL